MLNKILLGLILAGMTMDVQAATKQVLLVASSKHFDEMGGLKTPSPESLMRSVKSYLSRDLKVRGIIKVTALDLYAKKTMDVAYGGGGDLRLSEFYCHSLAQWYFWPEGRAERMKNLKGEGAKKWDYVVLVGDPYIMANMPGYYGEGVWHLSKIIRSGEAEPVLFNPWTSGDSKVVSRLQEVFHRVGRSSEIAVLPKKLSRTVEKKLSKPFEAQTPFTMKFEGNRVVRYHHTGTSSEKGIERALGRAFGRSMVTGKRSNPKNGKLDFNYGRGNSNFEKEKQYQVNPKLFGRSYGFPMQDHSATAEVTMLYGLDKRLFGGKWYEDGTDLGIAWDMVKQGEVEKDIRCLPIRLLWAKFNELAPNEKPCRDRWHMSTYLDDAIATYLYTLQSGRCPIGPKPDEKDTKARLSWLAQGVGYETAWRMSSLNERVSGLKVRPTNQHQTIKVEEKVEINVNFHYPPKKEVRVTVEGPKGSLVEPNELTFTPENYHEFQKVSFAIGEGKTSGEAELSFKTDSQDSAFSEIEDVWAYQLDPKKK